MDIWLFMGIFLTRGWFFKIKYGKITSDANIYGLKNI
jgi:hypothetical protein